MTDNTTETTTVSDDATTTTTNWRDSLPEDIRSSKVFDSVADIASLGKQFIDAQSHIGNSIRIPGEDAGQEAIDAFHQKIMNKTSLMVKPETPEDYQKVFQSMGMPEDGKDYTVPEGIDGANYEHLRGIAHDANMTNKQFESFVSSVSELDGSALESTQLALKESRDATQKEWGAAFDQNSSQAIALLEATGAPESVLSEAKAGTINGDALKWFYSLSQKLSGGEGSPATGDLGGNQVMTPSEATAQLGEIMSNKNSPYWNAMDPRHKELQAKAMSLRKLRNGKAA